MMNQVIELFKGATMTPAIVLAVAAFILGAIVMCLVCKLCSPCCGKKSCGTKKSANRRDDAPKFEKKRPAPADGSIEIYVGNLSYDLTEDQLKKEFEAYGKVNDARIITNRYNGKSKGFGFVHMPVKTEAETAVAALNDKEILGRKLKCNQAKNVY